jgi:predicted nucleic acid-binding protein
MASVLVDAGVIVTHFAKDERSPRDCHALFHGAATEHWGVSTTWQCIVARFFER